MYYLVVFLIVSKSYFVISSGVTVGINSYSRQVENQYHSQDGLGSYVYGYITPHSSKTEFRTYDGVTKGGYSYIDPNGELQTVEYTADAEHGFRVATTNLPKDDPEVAYAKFKHFEEFERIKAQHAALAAEHAALAADLASLAAKDWTEESFEKLLGGLYRNTYGASSYSYGSHNINYNSELERERNRHSEAYRAALESYKRIAEAQGRQVVTETNQHEDGQEKWEETWEAQRLLDQQQENAEDYHHLAETWRNDNNLEQHRASYEAVINAQRELIAQANAERKRQLQGYQQAQQAYRDSLSRLEETRIQQQSSYDSAIQAHRDAARRLEEARLRQEEAERQWNSITPKEAYQSWNYVNGDNQHQADYQAAIQAERKHIARAQQERDRQLQAYNEALQRYRESESRLENVRQQQNSVYETALQEHREAVRRLEQASIHQEQAEQNWHILQNSEQHRKAYQEAIEAERQLIAQAQQERDRQLQAYQEAQRAYQESARRLEETKALHSENYESTLESHQEAARRLEEATRHKIEAEQNLQNSQLWNHQNSIGYEVSLEEARRRALEEAEQAFKDFSVTRYIPVESVSVSPSYPIAPPKVYAPVHTVSKNEDAVRKILDAYSYGSVKNSGITSDGGYSYIDNNGVLQTMQYVSNHLKGFRISDVSSAIEALKGDKEERDQSVQEIQTVTAAPHQNEDSRQDERDTWQNGDGASYTSEIKYK